MIKTGLNVGVAAGWFTFLTTTDIIAIFGGIVGIVFTVLRIIAWSSERKKRNLEIELLEIKKQKVLEEIKNTPDE